MLTAGALLSAAAWAGMAYESLWMQSVLGRSAIQAGLIFLPCAFAAFVTSAVVGRVMHKAHPRLFIGVGLLVIAAGALAQAVIRDRTPAGRWSSLAWCSWGSARALPWRR